MPYTIETVDIDEAALVDPAEHGLDGQVGRIARAKFMAFGLGEPSLLLTADTLVACEGQVMGKPGSDAVLADLLRLMSGRALNVSTAVCVGERASVPELRVVSTVVQLRELSTGEIVRYVESGAGRDKAGGLALQSEAKPFIESVHGCWSNVLGLPLCQTAQLLAARAPLFTAPRGGPAGSAGQVFARTTACTPELCGSAGR